ncbi:VTC domain-containing protein [Streptomyces sp. NBC_00154]|uniref:VTC domain-containing protein n=1 Tax=Streptomyces sp. NBC_00154 TaxID=2975670 RepID=UPI0022520A10|nr:VTC domain-containing protein [Streptomyces sp. NBC_00154]MCX5316767.1 VTC domain-containing protein [Streptomyces sp. NBC_00154]
MSVTSALSAGQEAKAGAGERLARLLRLDELHGVPLAKVDAVAALQHRVDRKYLIPVSSAARLVEQLAGTHHVLDIRGRRTTEYRSTYFDTAHLAAWRAHNQGRRRRWKVRTRLYAEDGICRMEVKTKDGRGATVKHAHRIEADAYGGLEAGTEAAAFVDRVLEAAGVDVRAADLAAAGEVCYRRAALADLEAGTRLTLDGLLACHRDGRTAALDDGYVLVETKGAARPAPADRGLLALGARPVPISKYVIGLSLLVPNLPDNNMRRLARTRFRTGPRSETPAARPERTLPA